MRISEENKVNRFALRALFLTAALVGCMATPAQVGVNATIGGFYDDLVTYGRWVD